MSSLLFDIYLIKITYLIKEPPWTSYFCFAETLGIVGLTEQIMVTSVDPLSFLRAVTRDGGFANGRGTTTARPRGAISRACTSHTRDDNGRFVRDVAFTDCQSGLRERDKESPRITNNNRSRIILDLAWERLQNISLEYFPLVKNVCYDTER